MYIALCVCNIPICVKSTKVKLEVELFTRITRTFVFVIASVRCASRGTWLLHSWLGNVTATYDSQLARPVVRNVHSTDSLFKAVSVFHKVNNHKIKYKYQICCNEYCTYVIYVKLKSNFILRLNAGFKFGFYCAKAINK